MDDSSTSPPPQQRREQNFRSTASNNWRTRDDTPRAEQPQRRNYNRSGYDGGDDSGGGGGGGGGRGPGSYSRQNQNQNQAQDGDQGNRLYVGNLLYTAQRADIENLFVDNGFKLTGVSMSVDPFTGRNPSYCFVDLESPEEAARAIEVLNGVDVLGRGVRVSPGVARKQGGQQGRVKDYSGGWGGRSERRDGDPSYKPSFDRWSRNDAPSHFTAPVSEGRRIYIGNLPRIEPHGTLEEEIQALFAQHASVAPAAVSKLISPHPSKVSEPGNHYYCFVDVENPGDVEGVIAALDGKEGSWGGSLRVNRAREQREGGRERKVVREQGDRRGYGGGGGGGGGGHWRESGGQ